MIKTKVVIKRVVTLSSSKVQELVSGWKNEMLGVESSAGFHIAHIHHMDELMAAIGNNVDAKMDTLRNAKVSNLNFISIR